MKEKSIKNMKGKIISLDIALPEGFEWDVNLDRDEDAIQILTSKVWPFYLTEKPDIEMTVPYQPFQYQRYHEQRFYTWGIRDQNSKQLVAFISCRCLFSKKEQTVFEQRGWQWSLQAAFEDEKVNTLCLTSATVAPQYRAKGLAKALVNSAKQQAVSLGFHSVLVPVRPTNKVNYPEMSMQEYITEHQDNSNAKNTSNQKLLNDPWITLHSQQGAQLLNICHESMIITASIRWWEQRLNCSLEGVEQLQIPFGLVPLKIYYDRFMATYTEPNIWMKYFL